MSESDALIEPCNSTHLQDLEHAVEFLFDQGLSMSANMNNLFREVGPPSMPLLWMTLLLLFSCNASAHSETGGIGGFASGFMHPLRGLDHIVAMVAVGLWGAFLGAPAMWVLPVIFPMVMAVGGAIGILGIPLPGIETGIALSGVILGSMVLFAVKPP